MSDTRNFTLDPEMASIGSRARIIVYICIHLAGICYSHNHRSVANMATSLSLTSYFMFCLFMQELNLDRHKLNLGKVRRRSKR